MNEADRRDETDEVRPVAAPIGLWLFGRGGAPVSTCLMLLAVFIAIVGPLVTPHAHDRVFRDYVFTPPLLTAHPNDKERDDAVADFAAAMHVEIAAVHERAGRLDIDVRSDHAIDLRILRYFGHSDIFAAAEVQGASGDGRKLHLAVPLKRSFFPFGTDANGRDLASRLFIAMRVSLAVGLLATLVALLIGVAYGAVAGYVGGIVDSVMMRIVEIIYALPFIFFVIVLVVVFGRNIALVFVAIGAVEWLDMARITRGQALSIKKRDYVLAAEALGASPLMILRRHVVPNMVGPVIAFTTLLVPRVILAESFVSFLGLGVQEPLTSLGLLIADGARNIQSAPYLLIFPALCLAVLLAALTRIGQALSQKLAGGSS